MNQSKKMFFFAAQQDESIKARSRSPSQGNIWEGGERKVYSVFKFASARFCIQSKFAPKDIIKTCVANTLRLFFTLKKGYTPETSVLIDIFDTS